MITQAACYGRDCVSERKRIRTCSKKQRNVDEAGIKKLLKSKTENIKYNIKFMKAKKKIL